MAPFTFLTSIAAPLPIANIDTDQILPKQFLTTLERTGLGAGLFHDMRFEESGAPRPDFVLSRAEYQGVAILVAGANFGCGSSREHAAWALADFGIRCIIAPSFGDIFTNNCLNNGILPVALSDADVGALQTEARGGADAFSVSLPDQTVKPPSGKRFRFEIAAADKRKLMQGLDDISLTLRRMPDIEAFERGRAAH